MLSMPFPLCADCSLTFRKISAGILPAKHPTVYHFQLHNVERMTIYFHSSLTFFLNESDFFRLILHDTHFLQVLAETGERRDRVWWQWWRLDRLQWKTHDETREETVLHCAATRNNERMVNAVLNRNKSAQFIGHLCNRVYPSLKISLP